MTSRMAAEEQKEIGDSEAITYNIEGEYMD